MNAVVSVPTPSAAEALRAHETRLECHRGTLQALTQQIERCAPAIQAFETKRTELNALQEQRRDALIAASDDDADAAVRAKHLKRDIEAADDALVVLEHRANVARQERDRLQGLLANAERMKRAEESERPMLECNLLDEELDAVMHQWDKARETVKRLEQQAREIASRHDAGATEYERLSGRKRGERLAGLLRIQIGAHERTASDLRLGRGG